MSLYFFRISQGRYSGASDQPYEFESREAAWTEMTAVCSNLLGGISRSLKENAEWHMELLDEAKKRQWEVDHIPAEELETSAREVIDQPADIIQRVKELLGGS